MLLEDYTTEHGTMMEQEEQTEKKTISYAGNREVWSRSWKREKNLVSTLPEKLNRYSHKVCLKRPCCNGFGLAPGPVQLSPAEDDHAHQKRQDGGA
ncbi:hypothetical protein RRG08_036474 [Elysia crispata]|uniref:Uncharacterized protein n=1 Tax=Elysia crispata TaxID=231223 RepID=A0AAE0ZK04_9GAST|nr:hypothetical protein RRG08_036474 [Elysia crispata]